MKSPFGLRRIMPSFAAILSIAAFSLLAGCGQKGPLFLPQKDGQKSGTPTGKNVPAVTLPDSDTSVSR